MPDAARHSAVLSFCLKWYLLFGLLLASPAPLLAAPSAFVTWKGFEADKLACIWLIKRFINPAAEFTFLSPGSEIKEGIPFDVPYGELRRDAKQPTFSQFLTHYHLDTPGLKKLEKVIRDIEINTWAPPSYTQSKKTARFIKRLLLTTSDEQEIIDRSLLFFDGVYAALSNDKNDDNK